MYMIVGKRADKITDDGAQYDFNPNTGKPGYFK